MIELEQKAYRRGRPAVQPQFAQADRRDLVRAPEAAGGEEDAERRAVDRRGRAREAGARLSAAEDCCSSTAAVEAQVHLHRQAAAHGEPAHRPRAHQLRAGDRRSPGGSRRTIPTCRTSRSAPPRAGASARPSSRRRATRSSRPTIRRSSCASWRTSRRTRACSTPSRAARTSIARPPRRSSGAARGEVSARAAPLRQGRSTSA